MTAHYVYVLRVLPVSAERDYREYVRQGGRYDVAIWWERYKDNYQGATEEHLHEDVRGRVSVPVPPAPDGGVS